jgi:hypothetical protein
VVRLIGIGVDALLIASLGTLAGRCHVTDQH